MGKHGKKPKYPRLRKLLKVLFVTGLSALVLGAGAGYGYIKYLEDRLGRFDGLSQDKVDFKEVDKVISDPLPRAPINFVFVGTDANKGGNKSRTDSIILAQIRPKEKKSTLVFIPRDFRVQIPGMGKNKINAAYAYGGPSLTIKTIEEFAGVSVNHYVQIDFTGFQKMVDVLGGVYINVPEPIVDKSKKYRMFIPAGHQKFDGETALNYVRYRHDQRGDFGRIERQQAFLTALSEQVFRLRSVLRWPKLISILGKNAQTDLATTQMLRFVNMFRAMDESQMEMISLPGTSKTISGVSYVLPKEEEVAQIMEAFRQGESVEGFKQVQAKVKIPRSSIRVEILNGIGESGLADKVRLKLNSAGFKVVATANAENFDYEKTTVMYDSSEDYQKAVDVQDFFDGSKVELSKASLEKGVDVLVIIGEDYEARSKKGKG